MSKGPTFRERKISPIIETELIASGLQPLQARLFASRGITNIKDIRSTLADILPIHSLKNVEIAAKKLADLRESGARVCIVSDYDCDGATACSVLLEAFRASGVNIDFLVPDREIHGYGLTASIVNDVANLPAKPEYIITVDAGISSHDGVLRAKEHGIKVIITDHHLAGSTLPDADIIVNPNQPGDSFESKNIAGCGVAWYVATAYYIELCDRGIDPGFEPEDLLPYVAMGTVADVVILDKNNRILVSEGLSRIRKGQCSPGIVALAGAGKRTIELSELTTQDIGFQLGPRINAAGRLKTMKTGIDCLTTKDSNLAISLAAELNETNELRKQIQEGMLVEAEKLTTPTVSNGEAKSIVIFCPEFHKGIIGIVAGKLKELHYRPTFVITTAKNGGYVGSGRSIPGFHLKHALDELTVLHEGVLSKFGGHAMAAGVSIAEGKLGDFIKAFDAICDKHLTRDILEAIVEHDGNFPTDCLSTDLIKSINSEVWGQGFLAPLFVDQFIVKDRKLLSEGKHLKLTGSLGSKPMNVIAFSMGDRHDDIPKLLTIAHQPNINKYDGKENIQLQVSYFPGLLKLTPEQIAKDTQVAEMEATAQAEIAKKRILEVKKAQLSRVSLRASALVERNERLNATDDSGAILQVKPGGLLSRVQAVRMASTGETEADMLIRRTANRQKLR